jgi:hypothetical protein
LRARYKHSVRTNGQSATIAFDWSVVIVDHVIEIDEVASYEPLPIVSRWCRIGVRYSYPNRGQVAASEMGAEAEDYECYNKYHSYNEAAEEALFATKYVFHLT